MKYRTAKLAACGLAVIWTALFAGCSSEEKNDSEKIETAKRDPVVIAFTDYTKEVNGAGSLATIIHDGHWFVVEARYNKGGIMHHPGCPCGGGK